MTKLIRRALAPLLLACAGFAGAAPVQLDQSSGEARPQFFSSAPVVPKAANAPHTRSQAKPVRFNAGQMLKLGRLDEVEVSLPGLGKHAAVFQHSTDHGGGIASWVGYLKGHGNQYRVILTTGPGGSFGIIETPQGTYRIVPGGTHDWLVDMAQEAAHIPEPPHADDGIPGFPSGAPTDFASRAKLLHAKATPTPQAVIDMMFVVTDTLADKLGTTLATRLNYLITVANQSYVDSEIAITLRMVHHVVVAYSGTDGSSGSDSTALNAISPNDGIVDSAFSNIETLRATYGADMVTLLRDGHAYGGSGVAWVIGTFNASNSDDFMYSTVQGCVSGCEHVWVHEVGHNMGSRHDRATTSWQAGGAQSQTGTNYGYSFCKSGAHTCNAFLTNGTAGACSSSQPECSTSDASNFTDIMAYFHGTGTRLYKFSNPNINCTSTAAGNDGIARPCGAVQPNSPGTADAANTLNTNRTDISGYRTGPTNLSGSVQFTATGFNRTEATSPITFTVSRSGGSSGAIAVTYTVTGGTAVAGTDFTVATGTLNWADGDTADKTFNVTLANDGTTEGTESFTATLSSPTNGAYLGFPSSAQGLITEDFGGTAGGSLPSGYTSSDWTVANDRFFEGATSLRSGQITSGTSSLTYTGTIPAGTIAFAYNVSSYDNYGKFEFLVDGVVVHTDSGESGWKIVNYTLATGGSHTLVWRYSSTLGFRCNAVSPARPAGNAGCEDRAWVDAISLPTNQTLTVSKAGTGTGTVTSSPAGISCGATCAVAFGNGSGVTLTAAADGTSFFAGWSGGGCSGTGTCTVTLSAATTVTATFTLKSASTTTVTSNTNPSVSGGSVTFTATVSGSSGTPTGTVTFKDGTTTLCSAVSLNGSAQATCTTSALAVGTRSITAEYSGNTTYSASTSTTLSQVVQSSTFTLTVTKAGTGTGTVTSSPAGIACGATCSASFANGSAPALSATPDTNSTFTAWSGDCSGASCAPAMNAAKAVTATFTAKPASTTAVASSLNPSITGQSVTFTATVSGSSGTPTGTVTFKDGASAICSSVVLNGSGQATCTTSALSVATHSITVEYSGSATYATSVSTTLSQVVNNKTATSTGLASSLNPSVTGQSVTFTATVTGGTPTGTVTFNDGATPICSAVTLAGGSATCTTSSLSIATHSISAVYSGDATHATSTSSTLSQSVLASTFTLSTFRLGTPGGSSISSSPAGISCPSTCSATFNANDSVTLTVAPDANSYLTAWGGVCSGTGSTCVVSMTANRTVTATFATKSATTTTLVSSLNPSVSGQTVTFTATVSGSPTGSVTFKDGGSVICASVALTSGTAQCATASLAVGTRSITAEYSGNATTAASTSSALSQVVSAQQHALGVTFAGTGGGSVTSSPAGINCTANCNANFAQGTVVTLTAAPNGSSYLASWSGAGCSGTGACVVTMSAAQSVTATFTVKTATTTTLASSLNPSTAGQSVTFTATVTGGTPTGTVTFRDGATAICSSVALAGGTAQCATGALVTGTRSITAEYSGSTTHAASASSALSQVVNVASFTLTVAKAGTGSGSVTSSPAGINCGATCAAPFNSGTTVTLTATPASTSYLASWSGGGCSGTGTCVVAISAAATVTATFTTKTATTTAVTSSANPSISGQAVTFTATVAGGTPTGTVTFLDGATQVCANVALSGNQAQCVTSTLGIGSRLVTAVYNGNTTHAASTSFTLTQVVQGAGFGLSVSKAGSGTGSVTSAPAGIDCGATCTSLFDSGAVVVLTAAAASGSTFGGWSGSGCTGTGTCSVTMSAARSVTATFNAASTLAVSTSVESVDFGSQSMATTSPAQSVTVTNAGAATLTLSGITVSNAQFAQANDCGATLAVGAACTVTLTFSPVVTGAAVGSATTVAATLSIASNAAGSPKTVALTGSAEKSLVTHFYRSILNRAPDSAGKAFWESESARLQALGANVNEIWFVMANYFFNSPEYIAAGKSNTVFMSDVYNTFFNRPADSGGFNFWMSQIGAGLSREGVTFWFMFSNEFRTFTQGIFGNTAARPEVDMVMDLFRGILNRFPETAALNAFVGTLRTAQCAAPAQRAGAVYQAVNDISYFFLFGGSEYPARARTNTQYVSDMYNAFLRRGGSDDEMDFWINQLNPGTKDRNQLRVDFIASPEFGARVNAVIAAGCVS